jgi:NAD(P)-dependent dehydrogenase (short-subunit alcohol dehydrogenase family)
MKTAVVTGVSSGIGQTIAEALKGANWHVDGLSHAEVDLSNLNEVTQFCETLKEKYGQIDALIHVAGVWHDDSGVLADKPLTQFSAQQIIETVNVGLTSFMILAAKLLPAIPKDGTVVGISGTFSDGGAGWVPYYTSKRALEDFLVGLSQDYPDGPRVFGISPADTATPAYKKFYPEYAEKAQSAEAVADLCLELLGGTRYKSGDIIKIRNGKASEGYHS